VARLCDIQLLDHVIIGDGTDQYMSFADDGMLQYEEPSVVSSPA
jgi:DNA repair protein RadC